MISRTKKKFWDCFYSLPLQTQKDAKEAFRMFQENPFHAGLNFEKLQNSAYRSVRIGLHYRALGQMTSSNTITWVWIGTHAEYDKMIG